MNIWTLIILFPFVFVTDLEAKDYVGKIQSEFGGIRQEGSGVFVQIGHENYFVTNEHVLAGKEATTTLEKNKIDLIFADYLSDLAVFKVGIIPETKRSIDFSQFDEISLDKNVIVQGYPGGQNEIYEDRQGSVVKTRSSRHWLLGHENVFEVRSISNNGISGSGIFQNENGQIKFVGLAAQRSANQELIAISAADIKKWLEKNLDRKVVKSIRAITNSSSKESVDLGGGILESEILAKDRVGSNGDPVGINNIETITSERLKLIISNSNPLDVFSKDNPFYVQLQEICNSTVKRPLPIVITGLYKNSRGLYPISSLRMFIHEVANGSMAIMHSEVIGNRLQPIVSELRTIAEEISSQGIYGELKLSALKEGYNLELILNTLKSTNWNLVKLSEIQELVDSPFWDEFYLSENYQEVISINSRFRNIANILKYNR